MKKFLYFRNGSGGYGTTYCGDTDNIAGIEPIDATNTAIWFKKRSSKDFIKLTHDDQTSGTGHRVKDISKAIVEAVNSTAQEDLITMVDTDNNVFHKGLTFVTGVNIITDNGLREAFLTG